MLFVSLLERRGWGGKEGVWGWRATIMCINYNIFWGHDGYFLLIFFLLSVMEGGIDIRGGHHIMGLSSIEGFRCQ